MHFIKRASFVVVALVVLLFAAVWLFSSTSLFAGLRKEVVEKVLAKELDREVQINGDVRVLLGPVLHISAEGLALPSTSMPDLVLAEIGSLDFDLPFSGIWKGEIRLSNLEVDGTQLRLIVDEDAATSWASDKADQPSPDKGGANKNAAANSLQKIFTDRQITLTNSEILYQNAINGLDMDLRMAALSLKRGNDKTPASLQGTRTLNGAAVELNGSFLRGGASTAVAEFDHITLTFDATPAPDGYGAGFELAMDADIAELGQLLDVVKLNRVLEGAGHLSAVLKSNDGVTRLDDVNILATLDTGQSLEVTGSVGELGNPADVSLATLIRLYPQDAPPPATKSRRELKLISVDMVIDSVPGQVPQRKMVIETNGFTLDTAGEGPPPIKASQVSRTPDGELRLGNVNLRLGPPAEPFIILDGSVEDALRLTGIAAEGLLSIPAGALIAPENLQGADALGVFSGKFHLNGDITQLTLTDLEGDTQDTGLWDLKVHGTVQNVLTFEDINLDVDADVPSGAALLKAMNLEPVDIGQASISATLKSHGDDWNSTTDITVAESNLGIKLDLDNVKTSPVLRGLIESDLIKIEHLRDIVAASLQLRKLSAPSEPASEDAEAVDETASDETPDPASPFRNVTLLPLGRAILLSGVDLDIALDLRRLEGEKEVSSLQSELTLKDELLKAGPVKFEYGSAHFDLNGSMDLSDGDHILNLTGQAGGWQLDEILSGLNFKKSASGSIHADFDVDGGTASFQDFIHTMSGDVTVSMGNGSIETQLLDLAGLGVLPWLFSKERQKVAPVACLRAPLSLSGGQVSTKHTTMETDLVQVVVYGGLDLKTKSLDINVQPRKIGKPLSRSPWPITVAGPLAKPKIKVKDGPKRLRRKDGAHKMPAKRKACVPDILQLQ